MADTKASENGGASTPEDGGVLAKLPRTRPQRASARRVAARGASANGRAPIAGAREPERKVEAVRKPAAAKAAGGKRGATKARAASGTSQAGAKRPARSGGGPAPVAGSAATARAKASGASTRPADAASKKPAKAAKRPTRPTRRSMSAEEPAPRQGYECEGESANSPVAPPGGPELVATAAELVGELAKVGLSTGERLFRDVFSRLPRG